MKNNDIMRSYWLLFSCLCGSFPWIKWIILSGVGIVVLGVPIYGVWSNPVGFIIGGSIIFLVICLNAIALPNQMLAINSSKQISLLPNVRRASFVIFTLMCLLVSLIVAALISLKEHQVNIHSFFASLFLLSVVLIGNVVAVQKYPRMQAFIFLFLWALSPVYKWLMQIHWIELCIGIMALWIAFFFRWKTWKPIRFNQNIFGMSHEQLLEFNKQSSTQAELRIENIFSVKPVSLVDSLLIGRADGWISKARLAVGIFLMLLVLVIFFSILELDKSKFQHIFMIILSLYFSVAGGMVINFFRNINKSWLYFYGVRDSFFKKLERVYYSWIFVMGIPVILIQMGITYFMLDRQVYGDFVWVTAIFSLAVLATTFYLSLFIYHKAKGSLRWWTWFNISLIFVLIASVITYNLMWVEHREQIIHFVYFFIAGSALGVLTLRHWVKKKWMSVDFVRVKS